MTEFENIKSQWESQPEVEPPKNGSIMVKTQIAGVKAKQRITKWVLMSTLLVLFAFFMYIKAYNNLLVSFGLFLMIGSLLVRVGIEYLSVKQLDQLDITADLTSFKSTLIGYYKNRLRTHYIFTPIIFCLYIIGFVILLPFFKVSLSTGFYTYIIASGIIVFLLLALLIINGIRKELTALRQIKA